MDGATETIEHNIWTASPDGSDYSVSLALDPATPPHCNPSPEDRDECQPPVKNALYYGDNLELLRNPKYVREGSVDLCYIDPPFNSKRIYNKIYNNKGREDQAQASAYIDIHTWNDHARECYQDIITNKEGRFTVQTIELIKGLRNVLTESPLLAYLVAMTARITEVQRLLKETGSFFLHCDPTASHYLKLVCDAVFCGGSGGDFINEIIWCYSHGGKSKKHFGRKHDVILWYSKSENYYFNPDTIKIPMKSGATSFGGRMETDADGRKYRLVYGTKNKNGETKYYKYYLDEGKIPEDYWTDINSLQSGVKERIGWPTQKPAALLRRIIKSTTREGDLVLDAYCGCGTTIAVAHAENRQWIGMDITYQAIATILNRLEEEFPGMDLRNIAEGGAPRDIESAIKLAHKRDDRLRKEFEKWAILTYCHNRAVVNEKKGADKGIDGVTYILTGENETAKMVIQVKSGNVSREDISKLRGDMGDAALGVLITLEEPSKPMKDAVKHGDTYTHPLTGKVCDRIRIITIRDMLEKNVRLDLPQDLESFRRAVRDTESKQLGLKFSGEETPTKKAVASASAEVPKKKQSTT